MILKGQITEGTRAPCCDAILQVRKYHAIIYGTVRSVFWLAYLLNLVRAQESIAILVLIAAMCGFQVKFFSISTSRYLVESASVSVKHVLLILISNLYML